MTVNFKHPPRVGKFQCDGCNLRFELQPGGHDTARCPRCNTLYYQWLDYEHFSLARGANLLVSARVCVEVPATVAADHDSASGV